LPRTPDEIRNFNFACDRAVGIVTAISLGTNIIFTGVYALSELKGGRSAVRQDQACNDLVADILAAAEYVIEGISGSDTGAARSCGIIDAPGDRLVQLKKEYDAGMGLLG